MNGEMTTHQAFYPDRRLVWRVLWLVGYSFLLVWGFGLGGSAFGLVFAIIGGALILGGCAVLFVKMGPILVAGESGLKLFGNFMGGGKVTEIPWTSIDSVSIGYRNRYNSRTKTNQLRQALIFKLTGEIQGVESSGQFYWSSGDSELELANPPRGGFNRALSVMGQFAPHLRDAEPRDPSVGVALYERILDIVVFGAVAGTALLAVTGNLHVLDGLVRGFTHLVK